MFKMSSGLSARKPNARTKGQMNYESTIRRATVSTKEMALSQSLVLE